MLKLYIVIITWLLLLFLFSQEMHSGLSVGVICGRWIGDDGLLVQSLANRMNQNEGFSNYTLESAPRIGVAMGLFLELPVKKSFSFQSEISYTQKGIFIQRGRILY